MIIEVIAYYAMGDEDEAVLNTWWERNGETGDTKNIHSWSFAFCISLPSVCCSSRLSLSLSLLMSIWVCWPSEESMMKIKRELG